ncbi:ABC transporter substrate-binding protein [Bacillus sp. D386]|uniref:ABC transporter substrate-binding protein n=1 Tax=Bacillus sp. D386 TaxID=2587155 RepID=UPI00111F6CB6|nr:ABC transporter substrate-binding protein [Bacillus sp. D386]
MKKIASLSLLVFLSVFALFACGNDETVNNQKNETNQETSEYPKTLTDGRGEKVTIKEKPSRIVSTTLAIDEYLLPLAEEERIAAVTKMSTDSGISNVADLTDGIDTKIESVTSELVLSLQPDLVLIPSYVDPEVLKQIDAADITTYQLKDDSSISGVLDGLMEVGTIVGEEDKAEEIIADVKKRMSDLQTKAKAQTDKKRVVYWTQQNSSVTENTTIGEIITLAGGINAITEAGITGEEYPDYPNLSKEKLVELNPDVIITSDWQYDGSKATFVEEWKKDPALKNLKAFKNNEVHVIDSANLTTASHFVIEGAEDIYQVLYGE